ncbi:MAG TPA: serine hydrolase [Candidatus Acidoferrum sp.]|nr:serine hydrolase [Candidatus Acidoferrum sp.]
MQVASAQPSATAPPSTPAPYFPHSPALQQVVDRAVKGALDKFANEKLGTNQIAVTLVDLRDPHQPVQASYRGNDQIYPASVIKLFYLVAVHRWLEDGKLKDTPELRRAMRDMIVDSLNEATGYLVDLLTDTTSGPELSPPEMEQWYYKRNAVNRYFASLGYTNINVNRKPWCEGPYGREMQSVQMHKPNHRNWLTTDATARLLTEIATGQAVSPSRCAEMLQLLHRDPSPAPGDKNDQGHAYTALALPPGSKLWSKAGWTSECRHDAAYVELPNGAKFVLVIFTMDHAGERGIIPAVARPIIEAFSVPAPGLK